jgi:LasA protease
MPDKSLKFWASLTFITLIAIALACSRSAGSGPDTTSQALGSLPPDLARQTLMAAISTAQATLAPSWKLPSPRPPGAPALTPTPDGPHPLPTIRNQPEDYTVQSGDTLGQIAASYGVSVEAIVQANSLASANVLDVGQVLTIPAPTPGAPGPSFKVIPDSELVYSPSSLGFDIDTFVQNQGGFLSTYWESVDGNTLSGAQVVLRVAEDYSVNPRLLLALLQHQSGWVGGTESDRTDKDYPLGWRDSSLKGLFRQLSWAANQLNRGYYLWRVNGVAAWILPDGSLIPVAPTINAGTAGVQNFFAQLDDRASWETDITETGLFATYSSLFGFPFDFAIEPLVPPGLTQPLMHLPFEAGQSWSFTGGPHSAWGTGSAWAALDFAPPGEAVGCVTSTAWVTAVADGLILRAGQGAVIQDLDGDGNEQTGWVVLYMHIDTGGRVQPGTEVKAGEHIGHPSCEGGVSTGTHVHLARRYNGEWIAADQGIPFDLDGWLSIGTAKEYDGYLQHGTQKVEAFGGNSPDNQIQR